MEICVIVARMKTSKISDSAAVRDMYDAEAEAYSTMMDSEIKHPLYSDTLERLQTRIANLSGTIIDAPCGSGQLLVIYENSTLFRQTLPPPSSVTLPFIISTPMA